MSAELRTLVSWQEAFGADPFIILSCHFPDGEQFMVIPAEAGKRTTVEAMGLPLAAFVSEAELRNRLMQAGLSQLDIDTRLRLARDWATTVTPQ
jgi:hypothetical protein